MKLKKTLKMLNKEPSVNVLKMRSKQQTMQVTGAVPWGIHRKALDIAMYSN